MDTVLNNPVVGWINNHVIAFYSRKFKSVSIKDIVVPNRRIGMNNVYELVLSDGVSLIVRYNERKNNDFSRTWELMRKIGVGKNVLSGGYVNVNSVEYTYIVSFKVEGVTLQSVLNSIPINELERVLNDAVRKAKSFGKHNVEGFGNVSGDLKGYSKSELEFVLSNIVYVVSYLVDNNKFLDCISKVLLLISKNIGLFNYKSPKLVYVDTHIGNIIVSDTSNGFIFNDWIDFDLMFGADPLLVYRGLASSALISKNNNFIDVVKKIMGLSHDDNLKLRIHLIVFLINITAKRKDSDIFVKLLFDLVRDDFDFFGFKLK